MNKPKNSPVRKIIAENRKARFNFEILDTLEAGLVLTGTEVKSLRANQSNIAESYASFENGEFWLINSYIPEYTQEIALTTSRGVFANCLSASEKCLACSTPYHETDDRGAIEALLQ